ncbi:MAG: hypothetical protein AAFR84_09825, partial [Pseudomonadota bacterium]
MSMITISGIGGDPKTVSGAISETVGDTVARIDRMDQDPALRDAIGRAAVRIFTAEMVRRFALERAVIAEEVLGVGQEAWSPPSAPRADEPEPVVAEMAMPDMGDETPEAGDTELRRDEDDDEVPLDAAFEAADAAALVAPLQEAPIDDEAT